MLTRIKCLNYTRTNFASHTADFHHQADASHGRDRRHGCDYKFYKSSVDKAQTAVYVNMLCITLCDLKIIFCKTISFNIHKTKICRKVHIL